MRLKTIILLFIIAGISTFVIFTLNSKSSKEVVENGFPQILDEDNQGGEIDELHPLSIESLRGGEYPGSEITVEQVLTPGPNYQRNIASYKSEGLKIYALLTIPNGEVPGNGWPVVIFNHGFIPPTQYKTTERYIAYTDGFSRNGYIVFRPDYRGHGNSEGTATGGYGSNAYTIDVLNAVSSIKRYNDQLSSGKKIVDVENIGMWGHSMGGHITLKSMVVNKDIKAGVIWGGVVASYPDLLNNWRRRNPTLSPNPSNTSRSWRQVLVAKYGEPEKNPTFWNSISSNSYLADISGPVQLHHGGSDASVPVAFSNKLAEQLKEVDKEVELYTYSGDDHDITSNFGVAMNRSIEFFDKYLKD